MKRVLLSIYFFFSLTLLFAQLQNEEKRNRHTIGIGLLPLCESLLVQNTYHLKVNYGYFIKPNIISYASVYYFNNGKENYGSILGAGGNSQFSLIGNQFKVGIRKNSSPNISSFKFIKAYHFIGFSFGHSNYEIEQDILLEDFLSNIVYVKKYDSFDSYSFEFEYGMFIRGSKKISIVPNLGIGFATNNEGNLITVNRLPDIGFTGRKMGMFLNFSIDLFYNLNK